MSMILDGTNGATFNDGSLQAAAASPYVLKNRIINGSMQIDQRNAGASVSTSSGTNGTFQQDRWKTFVVGTMVVTSQQSSTAPASFVNSIAYTVSTADTSIASGDVYVIEQPIEGLNVSDFGFGTANATTITLSFWVRSSITGTYCGSITNSAENRAYIFSYSITSANTWEQKSITITGDTSGTWLTTNGIGLRVRFTLAAGSTFQGTANTWSASNVVATSSQTQWVSTNGATFYITGVQLEVGSTATPFERRLYTTELQLCQRYYYRIKSAVDYGLMGWGQGLNSSLVRINIPLPVTMRVPATGFDFSAANTYLLVSGSNNPTVSSLATSTNGNSQITQINVSTSTSATVNAAFDLFANASAAAYVGVIAEL